MKNAITAAIILTISTAFPALAAQDHESHTNMEQGSGLHSGHGKINTVNASKGTVSLTHDPMPSLKWGKMTMDFKVSDSAMLKDLKPGTQVDFQLQKGEKGYLITKISPSERN